MSNFREHLASDNVEPFDARDTIFKEQFPSALFPGMMNKFTTPQVRTANLPRGGVSSARELLGAVFGGF